MIANLDVDILKTFIAIAECGSFTRAAEEVHKTQSAVSMQMKRLEEAVGRALFARAGRVNRLTGDGLRLLDYARRIVRLNDEAMATFAAPELTGVVRLGTPDDYSDRLLPEILARFSRTHPLVQVDVECLASAVLAERARAGELDLALITSSCAAPADRTIRREPLVWVTSARHDTHTRDVLPVAISHPGCAWRTLVLDGLEAMDRPYRIAYASANSNAINAAVLSGLAIAGIPEIVMRAGMCALGPGEGFPPLGEFDIGLVESPGKSSPAVQALASHIEESLAHTGPPLHAAAE